MRKALAVVGVGIVLAAIPLTPAYADLVTDPSGVDMHVGDYPGWNQVYTDNFAQAVPLGSWPAAVSSKWGAYQEGWTDTSGWGTYRPLKTTYVKDGTLRVNMGYNSTTDEYQVSAPLPKHPELPDGGKFRIRMQYGFTDGYTPATAYKVVPLLWPDSNDWDEGEVDWPEANITPNAYGAFGFSHNTTGNPSAACGQTTTDARPGWHTWSIDWLAGANGYVKFYKDGVWKFTCTGAYVPQDAMHWVLQFETKLTGANPEPAPPTTAKSWVMIDWVEVYEPA